MWRVAGEVVPGRGRAAGGEPTPVEALPWLTARADFFDPHRPVYLARAPGRIDLMGGFADYSGARVLELPIAAGTWAAAQESDRLEVEIESLDAAELGAERRVVIPMAALSSLPVDRGQPLYAEARWLLTTDSRRAWAAYVAGAVVMLRSRRASSGTAPGLRVLVRSQVPSGKGLSSSAALEVAAFEAVAAVLGAGAALDDRELALAAQTVENQIVGAPCGVMDQMTAVSGRRDHLLEIVCQPAELVGQVALPAALEVMGIDSGVRHAVAGSDYRTVRTAAFMGYRIIADAVGLAVRPAGPGRVTVDDPRFGGYLANITPELWRDRLAARVPEEMAGADFLARHHGITDAVTAVDPDRRYRIRSCTAHPILENQRVRVFRDLLADGGEGAGGDPDRVFRRLGDLMGEAHASYGACGVGSAATDRLAELARAAGPQAGIFGAKITGGGSGGTVALLIRRGSRAAVEQIAARYTAESGRAAPIFGGSSSGSRAFGVYRLIRT